MKILSVTTLFPNLVQPRFGIFIANRLNQLKTYENLDIDVIAPIAWFPFAALLKQFAYLDKIPEATQWHELSVRHPRYLSIPGYGFGLKPQLIANSILSSIDRSKSYDLLDAHYAYPDGAAAVLVAKALGIPMVLSVRGSDINQLVKRKSIRRAIQHTLRHSDHIISVSRPLAEAVRQLDNQSDVSVIENGVDKNIFYKRPQIRKQQNLLLSVGNLIPLKRHSLIISALADLPDLQLVIIGSGPEKKHLDQLIQQKKLADRVQIIGNMTQEKLADWYNRAQVTLLTSESEGCPNVVLESIACGTPVLATRVGACEDLIDEGQTGLLIDEPNVSGIQVALERFQKQSFDSDIIAKQAITFSWRSVCKRQFQVYQKVINSRLKTA